MNHHTGIAMRLMDRDEGAGIWVLHLHVHLGAAQERMQSEEKPAASTNSSQSVNYMAILI